MGTTKMCKICHLTSLKIHKSVVRTLRKCVNLPCLENKHDMNFIILYILGLQQTLGKFGMVQKRKNCHVFLNKLAIVYTVDLSWALGKFGNGA